MNRRCRRTFALAVASVGLLLPASPAAAADGPLASAAATPRSCAAPFVMYVTDVRCSFARRWIRSLRSGDGGPRGWDCSSGSKFRTGGYCERGQRSFGWHPAD